VAERIAAREKFKWRGYEFSLSRSDSKEAHWQCTDGRVQIRLLYRDVQDPETPPEFLAIIRMHGIPAGEGVGDSADLALAYAERDLRSKVIAAVRFLSELKRGKLPNPDA
jgi:hypothetical protein